MARPHGHELSAHELTARRRSAARPTALASMPAMSEGSGRMGRMGTLRTLGDLVRAASALGVEAGAVTDAERELIEQHRGVEPVADVDALISRLQQRRSS